MIKTLRDMKVLIKHFAKNTEISKKLRYNQIKIIDLEEISSENEKNNRNKIS